MPFLNVQTRIFGLRRGVAKFKENGSDTLFQYANARRATARKLVRDLGAGKANGAAVQAIVIPCWTIAIRCQRRVDQQQFTAAIQCWVSNI